MKTTDKLEFTEYTLEYRHGPRGGGEGPMSEWQDGSGHNNLTGTYNHVSQIKARIARLTQTFAYWFPPLEFKVFERKVVRTEWSEVELDA